MTNPVEPNLPSARHRTRRITLVVLACLTVCLTYLLFTWPLHGWHSTAPTTRAEPLYLGEVQQVHYIGGLQFATQVDIAIEAPRGQRRAQSLLLDGIARLPHSTALELRSGNPLPEVCVSGGSRCWPLLGQ